jgi:hypothetical protein
VLTHIASRAAHAEAMSPLVLGGMRTFTSLSETLGEARRRAARRANSNTANPNANPANPNAQPTPTPTPSSNSTPSSAGQDPVALSAKLLHPLLPAVLAITAQMLPAVSGCAMEISLWAAGVALREWPRGAARAAASEESAALSALGGDLAAALLGAWQQHHGDYTTVSDINILLYRLGRTEELHEFVRRSTLPTIAQMLQSALAQQEQQGSAQFQIPGSGEIVDFAAGAQGTVNAAVPAIVDLLNCVLRTSPPDTELPDDVLNHCILPLVRLLAEYPALREDTALVQSVCQCLVVVVATWGASLAAKVPREWAVLCGLATTLVAPPTPTELLAYTVPVAAHLLARCGFFGPDGRTTAVGWELPMLTAVVGRMS